MQATITRVRPFGTWDTIVQFEAETDDGATVIIGVDHRPASELIVALAQDEEIRVHIESWQILGRVS